MRYVLGLAIALAGASAAYGFGTINQAGQNAEHERITRRALACTALPSNGACFEGGTLALLAGKSGTFGAVGYPDSSSAIFRAKAHCDNGDQAGSFEACRAWMKENLDAAVKDAAGLLDASGKVRADQVRLSCVWTFNLKGKAKCNVLQDFGIVLHAAQDFYSHSNWVDSTAEKAPIGLGHMAPAAEIGLRGYPAFPAGLVSGCFSLWGACGTRVSHEVLNKDNGMIPANGGPIGVGTTPRGAKNGNFKSAVSVAIADTTDKWALLRGRLVQAYGAERGTRMICALSHDAPARDC